MQGLERDFPFMDDLEYSEFLEYPCRICGSVEYRYYGGGYNCREGHRNDELREQLADEDDFDFSRSQMRNTQLSMSKMTPQTARVATKKFRKTSGKGSHDLNARYGVTEEEQSRLYEEERRRFQRKGDTRKHVIMEAAMQILILQIEAIKGIEKFWTIFESRKQEKKQEFEQLGRKLFQAYANELSFAYSHTDALHPEISVLSPAFQPSKYFKKKRKMGTEDALRHLMNETSFDDLDRELLLDDYDYGNESSLSDSEIDESSVKMNEVGELGRLLDTTSNTGNNSDNPVVMRAEKFPKKRTNPLLNPFSYLNMTFLTHLAMIHTGIPVLFSDLARGLELGTIPGYRPDFLLSKDIVLVRFNNNELKSFHTRFLPGTDQLYYDSRLMLEMLARQCKLPDWEMEGSFLMQRIMKEMCLPIEFYPFVKFHVDKSVGLLNFAVLTEDLYLTPCSLVAAGILFFLRLLYTLTTFDEDENSKIFQINYELKSQGLPNQEELILVWKEKFDSLALFADPEELDKPVTNEDEYAQLLEMANRMLAPTCILDNKASIKGIFGNEKFEKVMGIKFNKKKEDLYYNTKRIRSIKLPFDNYSIYRSYPVNFNLNALPYPHRLALRLIQRLIGVKPADTEKIIRRVYESNLNVLETERVCSYEKKRGRKEKEKLSTDLYTFY